MSSLYAVFKVHCEFDKFAVIKAQLFLALAKYLVTDEFSLENLDGSKFIC